MTVLSSLPCTSPRNQRICPASRPVLKNSDWESMVTFLEPLPYCTILILVYWYILSVLSATCITGELKLTKQQWFAKNGMLFIFD